MSDLQQYIKKRKNEDESFSENYDEGFMALKLGALMRRLRKDAGLSQSDLAELLETKKTAISRLENHAEDMRVSTLDKLAHALGKRLDIRFVDQNSGEPRNSA